MKSGQVTLVALADRPLWVAWQLEPREADGVPTKVPYDPHRANKKAMTNKPSTWGTRGAAKRRETMLPKPYGLGGTGIVLAMLPEGLHLGGCDLDTCRDPASGKLEPWAQEIVDRFDSYTEVSPSGTGVKIFFSYDPAADNLRGGTFNRGLKQTHQPEIALYLNGRYFAVTDQRTSPSNELRVVPAEDIYWVVNYAGPAFKGARAPADVEPAPDEDREQASAVDPDELRDALASLDSDDRKRWINYGLAIKIELGEAGFEVWNEWSRKSHKYPGAEDSREIWRDLKPNGKFRCASIFRAALDGGWKPSGVNNQIADDQVVETDEVPLEDGVESGAPPPVDEEAAGLAPKPVPVILYKATDIKRMARQGEAALIAACMSIFQQTGKIVRIVRLDSPGQTKALRREAGAMILMRCTASWMRGEFMAAARWIKKVSGGKKNRSDPDVMVLQDVAITRDVIDYYLDNAGAWELPVLRGTVETPTLWKSEDGNFNLLQTRGYDSASGFYYDPGKIEFPPIPEHPTKQDAETALAQFLALFEAFPFVPDNTDEDWQPDMQAGRQKSRARSVVISAWLTGLVRRDLVGAPLHAFDATTPGTGKGYLARIISIILTGRGAAAMPWVRNEEEQRKRLLAVLMEGDPVILLDNITSPIGGTALNIVLTEPILQDRVLGKSSTGRAATNALFLATGNNLEFEGDMTRRAVRSRMDPRCERPEARQFKTDPLKIAINKRAELVVGGLTILRAYIAADRPMKGKVAHVASYEDWTLIREAIVWLGQPDPADTMKEITSDDPEANEVRAMMGIWIEHFGSKPVLLAKAVETARAHDHVGDKLHPRLFDAFSGALKGHEPSETRLGHWFKKYDNRMFDGLRFVRSHDDAGARMITLMKTNGAAKPNEDDDPM